MDSNDEGKQQPAMKKKKGRPTSGGARGKSSPSEPEGEGEGEGEGGGGGVAGLRETEGKVALEIQGKEGSGPERRRRRQAPEEAAVREVDGAVAKGGRGKKGLAPPLAPPPPPPPPAPPPAPPVVQKAPPKDEYDFDDGVPDLVDPPIDDLLSELSKDKDKVATKRKAASEVRARSPLTLLLSLTLQTD